MGGGEAAVPPAEARVQVLCVDDEPNVLEGLTLTLRRPYDVVVAGSGAAGLALLAADSRFAVIISDMRMPVMNGAVFLREASRLRPDATRMLLTGQADVDAAIAAVNEGQIFRFLSKPCAPSALLAAVEAAVTQHRLITAERELLEQTLHGSIRALTEVLALANPLAFGRATRIRQLVSELAERLDLQERWHVEVAAMLSHLGAVTLRPETVENVYYGRPLSIEERAMVGRTPAVTDHLLAGIPRLEVVRAMIVAAARPTSPAPGVGSDSRAALIESGAQILRAAQEFDALQMQGGTLTATLTLMRGRTTRYDAAVLDALESIRTADGGAEGARDVTLAELEVGMVFQEDVKLNTGALLAARGYEVTRGFVARAANFKTFIDQRTVRVTGPRN
jgi:CheY-like chemotaxis protein